MRVKMRYAAFFLFVFAALLFSSAFANISPAAAQTLQKYKIVAEMDVPHQNIDRHAIRVVVGQGLSKEQAENLIWYIAMLEQYKHDYEMLTIWMHHDLDENMGTYSVAMLNYGRLIPNPYVVFNDYYFEPIDETLIVKRLPLETRKEIFRYGRPADARLAKFAISDEEDVRISAEGYAKNWKTPEN